MVKCLTQIGKERNRTGKDIGYYKTGVMAINLNSARDRNLP